MLMIPAGSPDPTFSPPNPRPTSAMLRAKLTAVFIVTICSLLAAAESKWISLFDGRTLNGWQPNENPGSWVIENGAIVTKGPRSHLFYVGDVANHDFRSFEFHAEVMTTPGSNSGIYVHTRLANDPWPKAGYELQVINSNKSMDGGYAERKMTGSVYAVRNNWRSPAKDNVWFEYRIRVSGQTIQTFVNGELICQYTEAPNAWRAEDKPGRHLSSGTFALQAHDPDSVVRYRNIKVRLLPDDTSSLEAPINDRELDELITYFSDKNYALIDVGIVPGSISLIQAQAAAARQYGVALGYAFPKHDLELSLLGSHAPFVLINDRDAPPSVALMKAAKANGAKLAFSSGGLSRLDPDRLKMRLLAMREAGLDWQDIWVPGQ